MRCTALAGEPRLSPRLPKPERSWLLSSSWGQTPEFALVSTITHIGRVHWVQKHSLKQVPRGQCPTSPGITKARAEEEPSGAWTFSPFLMPLQDSFQKAPDCGWLSSRVFLASIHVKLLRIIICNVKLEASSKTQSKQIWVSRTLC